MPIDFFASPCNNANNNCINEPIKCLDIIVAPSFGINDINGGYNLPAKVIVPPNAETDFVVTNNSRCDVYFKAIDWCIPIYRTGNYDLSNDDRNPQDFSSNHIGNDLIKRCEGLLHYNDSILFIEIKNRPGGRGSWVKDAREKFEETIISFKEHHPEYAKKIQKPILCNPSFFRIHSNEMIQRKILKEKVGVEFRSEKSIII